ncbi:Zinc finger bed domain-containing protein 4 [Plakobranchus ocellatus]|uniref:Zinc finger bed domain-containing protein 4 n=1 Tax=Plakobranchus ocellatus TaxID=259542 RepID=A0AAV4A6C9_9GAST|nr:Zinc finger bed domain-containing protein 4 [Plakobranchus ocellatus]
MLKHLKTNHPEEFKKRSVEREKALNFSGGHVDAAGEGFSCGESQNDPVWKYLERTGSSQVTCSICFSVLNYDRDSTDLGKHMESQHPEIYSCLEEERGEATNNLHTVAYDERNVMDDHDSDNDDSNKDWVHSSCNKKLAPQNFVEDTSYLHHNGTKKKNSRSSIIWDIATKTNHNRIMCGICKLKLRFSATGSTSTMMKHIKRHHPEEYKKSLVQKAKMLKKMKAQTELEKKTKPLSHSQAISMPEKEKKGERGKHPVGTKQLDDLQLSVVNMLVSNLYPSSLVENASFKKMINTLNPKCLLPDKSFVERAMSSLQKNQQNVIKIQIDKTPGVAVSLDLWTYRDKRQYMTITGHFISNTWELQSIILKTVLLNSGADLSTSIADKLRQVLMDWNISNKVQCVVSDNMQQVNDAIAQLDVPHFHCLALTLNSIVQKSLKASDDIMYVAQRVRDVAGYIQNSGEATEKLNSLQNVEGKESLKLQLDTETSWISMYRMFKSYIGLHNSLRIMLVPMRKESMLLLPAELELVSRCIQALEPFYLAAVDMASDGYTTMSKFIPVFDILKQMTSKLSLAQVCCPTSVLAENNAVSSLVKELNEQVDEYMKHVQERAKLVPWTATLLDPRFKHVILKDVPVYRRVEENVQHLMTSVDQSGNESQSVNHQSNSSFANTPDHIDICDDAAAAALLWSAFDDTIKMSAVEDVPNDLNRYTEEALIHRQENPFLWWKERDPLYPKLCRVVKQFLCIPATSVPSGQVFSEEAKGYRRPAPQSTVANIPQQRYRWPVPQSAVAVIPHQGCRRPVPQSAVANIPHQGYRRPVPQSAVIPTRDPKDQCPSLLSPIFPTRDVEGQCSSLPSPISPTRDIESQCPSSPSPTFPTRDIEGQCPSPPLPTSPTRDIEGQCLSLPPLLCPTKDDTEDTLILFILINIIIISADANIPQQGYRRPVPQSDSANIPHQGCQRPVSQTVVANIFHQGCSRPAPQSVANIPHQGYRKPVFQSAVANIPYKPSPISPTRDIEGQCFSPPSPIYPTRDITSQCSSPPSPISPTRDIEGQCLSPPSPIYPTRDITSQCSSPPSPLTTPG